MGLISIIVAGIAVGLWVWLSRQKPVPVVIRAGIPLQLCDVLFGIVLIGGVPIICLLLPSYACLRLTASELIANLIAGGSLLISLIGWACAICHRVQSRHSPRWLISVEVVLGTGLALAYLAVVGMAAYTVSGG